MKITTRILNFFRNKPSFEIQYLPKENMLYAITRGRIFTAQDLLKHALEIDNEVMRHGFIKVYNDLLQTDFTSDITEYSDLVSAYVDEMALTVKNYKIACVIRKEFEVPGRYWEMACQNRGINGRIFFEEKAALDWLNL